MSPPDSQLFAHHTITVDPHQTPYRLDQFLVDRLTAVTRTRLQAGIKKGYIRVNDHLSKASYHIKPYDKIQVLLPTPPRKVTLSPEAIPIQVVYEDDHLMVINKEAWMVVHPGTGNWTGTLANALIYHQDTLATTTDRLRPGLVHRLDKGTSGLLVVAKTQIALQGLMQQFAAHTIQRTYWALVWGDPAKDQDTITQPIGRSISDRRIMTISEKGKQSITHYKVLERMGYVTLVTCQLETGRTHQIRVHMQYLGHPVFGDARYGGNRIVKGQSFSKYKHFVQNCFTILPYQALHAGLLGFIHPVTGKRHRFEAPLPSAFATVVEKWRRYGF